MELALKALSFSVKFTDNDKFFVHNNAAWCHWAREEMHDAIPHLIKAFDAAKQAGDRDRQSVMVANIGALLDGMGEWALSLAAATEAWRVHMNSGNEPVGRPLNYLSNMICLNCRLENFSEALQHAELLLRYLSTDVDPAKWLFFCNMSEAFALNGHIEKAEYCLERSRELNRANRTDHSKKHLVLAEAAIAGAKGDYRLSVKLAKAVIDTPAEVTMRQPQQIAAAILARAYTSMGRRSEAVKWKQFIKEATRKGALGELLSSQLRASLNFDQPVKALTAQELTCLSLSARGQTSADIGLKLGIKARTVNFHFSNILKKLNAMNRQEAIAKAMSANLLKSY